jgi:ABC-2 type transport system permease protein
MLGAERRIGDATGEALISAYVLGAAQVTFLFFVGWLLFGIELGNVGGIAVIVAVFLLTPVCIGLVAMMSTNSLLAVALLNLLVIVLGAIGGALVPVFLLPPWMEALAAFTPHYWALTALQDLMFRGAVLADVTLNLAILAAFAVVLLGAGLARFSYASASAS